MKGLIETKNAIRCMSIVLRDLKVCPENCKRAMTEELYATENAYQLVKKGIPFRDAYKKISRNFE
ncbi:MAG: hypothetical protein U9N35_08225 [Euryarchaeota archaeon]|nr:hypothetical protein [Euryarchaeota archaeon]